MSTHKSFKLELYAIGVQSWQQNTTNTALKKREENMRTNSKYTLNTTTMEKK